MENKFVPRSGGCPYQKGQGTPICEAGQLMVPSIEEVEMYCEGNYQKCPHYRAAQVSEMSGMAV